MKSLFLLITVFCALSATAQNYLITFAGKGASETVSIVRVENLMKNTTLNLNGSDVLRLKGPVGIPLVENQKPGLTFCPNPVTDHTTFSVHPPIAGAAVISIREITGRQLFSHPYLLDNSGQEFRISGLENGLFLVDFKGENFRYSGKLVSNGHAGDIVTVERAGNARALGLKKAVTEEKRSEVVMDFTTGDRLKFTAVSGNCITVVMDVPAQDKAITFNFIPCTDYEKNNYPVVQIGNQTFMAENLKSTVYNDGASIPLVADSLQWLSLTTPGYCYYGNNEAANKNVYGALYNYYAASHSKICPAGWHVPTYDEYLALTGSLGKYYTAGGKMKETGTVHWYYPNYGATNESGFTALPAGWRSSTGKFQELRETGEFWCSNSYSEGVGYGFYLDYWTTKGKYFDAEYVTKKVGLSVRCMKD